MTKMLDVVQTASFKKDRKRLIKQGKNMILLENVIKMLQAQKPLNKKYRDHQLLGHLKDFRECHIESD